MSENILSKLGYLKKVSDIYKQRSAEEVYDSFRCMSKDYQAFAESNQEKYHYSNSDFAKCTPEEQQTFINDQLNVLECLITESIYAKAGVPQSWKYIYDLLMDPVYKMTPKVNRKMVFSTSTGKRPIGDEAYMIWNGLQIIDLDIKDETIATKLREHIATDLSRFHWFLGVCKSASGKGLHVWTKITPLSITLENKKVEFLCNFRHKYSYIYIILSKYMKELGYSKDDVLKYLDMAMAKPQQGLFISSDSEAFMNTGFIDQRLDVNFEDAFNNGIESINWITHPELSEVFSKLEWFSNDKFDKNVNIELENIYNIGERDQTKGNKKHYKYNQRWQIANTLTAIYGYDKAKEYMIDICKDVPIKEIIGAIKTASIHDKPISLWALNELNKCHGFNIKVNGMDQILEKQRDDMIEQAAPTIANPQSQGNSQSQAIEFSITKNQYLSDIKDDIVANLGHLTLLEAGAGYGKTEMIKSFGGKVLLILPFTSTIKAKIEASEVTANWLYYYGTKRPSMDDLMGPNSMSMTIDKFSRLNLMEVDMAGFDYIVIDESHLLFTSSYRDVMAPCIQRLANCKAKVIMMTGTPTGELTFFPNIKYIKVHKEDIREKKFELNMCYSKNEQWLAITKSIAEDIMNGRKILFPTNNGTLYYEEIIGAVQQLLNDVNFGRQINTFYYKKSNYGDENMDNINFNKTIGNNDIICCTTYLSVGVDICDKYPFAVYFSDTMIAQDIEQFANRLRGNNLYIKMFLPTYDAEGNIINYNVKQRLDLSFDEEEELFARDILQSVNDMMERNNEEYKYNPLMRNILGVNSYIQYDENKGRYFINDTKYKLKVFEDRFSEYGQQLKIMVSGLKYYGYEVSQNKDEDNAFMQQISPERAEQLEEWFKSCRNSRCDYMTKETMNLLSMINDNNIDQYRQIMAGNYDIIRGKLALSEDDENAIYGTNIEILEKNLPIILHLYKYYDCENITEIFKHCTDFKTNKMNYTQLKRIVKFVDIVNNIKAKRIDFPIYRFILDARKWAVANATTNKTDITKFLALYSTKYANGIKNIVVEDVKFLDTMFEMMTELWKTIIIESAPKDNVIRIRPFELLWTPKDAIADIYGTSETQEFFLNQLIDDESESDSFESDIPDSMVPEIELTEKLSLNDVKDTLKDVIGHEYDYYKASSANGANDRFLEKQQNTARSSVTALTDSMALELLESTEDDTAPKDSLF